MVNKNFFVSAVVIFTCSLIFSFSFLLYLQVPFFTIIDHNLKFSVSNFTLLLFIFFSIFLIFWFLYSKLISYLSDGQYSDFLFQDLISYSPVFFLVLLPLTLKYYLTNEDLQNRIRIFLFIVIFTIFYLKFVQLVPLIRKKIKLNFSSLTLKKKLLILFIFSWSIYLISSGIMISKGIYFSGDEPHYILITHSLIKDKDINVANNYKNQDYANYMPSNIKLRIHGRFGKKGKNFIYSIHLPGISVLILPLYLLGLAVKGKILLLLLRGGIGILGALLGIQIYLFFKEHWEDEKKAILIWGVYSFTVPILFYSIHIYPEIGIALFSFYIFRKIYSQKKLTSLHLILLGILLSSFLWFGVKYHLLFFLMLLVSCYFLVKKHRVKYKIFYFLIFPFISYLLFLWFLYTLYGTFTQLSIYEGPVSKEYVKSYYQMILTKIPLSKRIETFFNYFLDQRDGLLLYSPIYFFSFLGLIELFKKKKALSFFLLLISLPYILGYAFLTQRGGYAPQTRPLIPVLWVFGIFLGSFFIYNKKKFFSFLSYFFVFLSLLIVLYLLNDPLSLYQPTTHEITLREGRLFSNFNNLYFSLTSYLPSFIKVDNSRYLPNYIWITLLIVFVIFYLFWKEKFLAKRPFYLHSIVIYLLISFFFFTKVLFPQLSLKNSRVVEYSKGRKIAFYSLSREAKFNPPSSFYLRREGKFVFIFSSRILFNGIRFSFGSKIGDYKVKLSFFDIPVFEGLLKKEEKKIIYGNIPFYKYRHLRLYLVNLNIKKLSSESIRKNPFYFHFFPLDK